MEFYTVFSFQCNYFNCFDYSCRSLCRDNVSPHLLSSSSSSVRTYKSHDYCASLHHVQHGTFLVNKNFLLLLGMPSLSFFPLSHYHIRQWWTKSSPSATSSSGVITPVSLNFDSLRTRVRYSVPVFLVTVLITFDISVSRTVVSPMSGW